MKLAKFIASISLALTIVSGAAALAQQPSGMQFAAPNAEACDRLAASPYDKARPAGVQGVPFEQLDAPVRLAGSLCPPGATMLSWHFSSAAHCRRMAALRL